MPGNLSLRRRVGQENRRSRQENCSHNISHKIVGTTIIKKRGAVLRPILYILLIVERRSMRIGVSGRRDADVLSTSRDRAIDRADVLGCSLYCFAIKSSVLIYLVLCSFYSASAAFASESAWNSRRTRILLFLGITV